MAAKESFDITTGCDLQEVDNAVNQALKELGQRFDFKKVNYTLEFRRGEEKVLLTAEDEYKLDAIWDVLQTKLMRRGVPIKNMERSEAQKAGGMTLRQEITLQQGIPTDTAKKIKFLKDKKLKKFSPKFKKTKFA